MKIVIYWLSVLPLSVLLWGAPNAVATETKQNDAESSVLFEAQGALSEGDVQLSNGSLYDVHLFEGQAGQIVRITLDSDDFNTFLLLQDSAGTVLARNDNAIEGSNAEIVIRISVTEQYRVLASAYSENDRGEYQLTIELSDEVTLRQTELRAEADRLFDQANEAFRVSQYQAALGLWQSALEIYRDNGDRLGADRSKISAYVFIGGINWLCCKKLQRTYGFPVSLLIMHVDLKLVP